MVVVASGIDSFFEHHGVEPCVYPADRHPLLWLACELIEVVGRVEQRLHLLEADAAHCTKSTTLCLVELEPQALWMV